MSPVLSKKTLVELRSLVLGYPTVRLSDNWRSGLIASIDSALRPKRSVAPARKRRVAKKKTRKEETALLRAAVFARADNKCEVCGAEATDLEHAFGRVRAKQSTSNCLALCRPCHVARTNSRPSAAFWWEKYSEIFWTRGNDYEAQEAVRLAAKHTLGRAS